MGQLPEFMPACVHCGKPAGNRPRGLCRSCYQDPLVRVLYPALSKYGRHGAGIGGSSRLPDRPTDATPGTWEKICVLAERAEAGLALFHPHDLGADVYFGPILRRLREA